MPPKHRTERLPKDSVSDLQRAFLQAVERLGIDLEQILVQVDEDPYALARAVRGADWEKDFAIPVREAYSQGALVAYDRRFHAVATELALGEFIRGEGNTPFARAHVSFRGAQLVRQIDESIREALVKAIDEGFQEYVNPRDVARSIVKRDIVGLDSRLAGAVNKRARMLREKGYSEAQIEKESAKYAKKLKKYRAENIARSEMISAANEGHLEAWDVAQDQGVLRPVAKKQWIAGATDRTCPICRDLHGKKVPLKSPFYSKVLDRNLMRPTAHPSCRCTMVLLPYG